MPIKKSNDILILEDEPLIAIDLEYTLHEAGFETHISNSCAEAMDWLEAETPLVAILDMHLKDGICDDVAAILIERGVPVIVCSGASKHDAPQVFQTSTWLPKPATDQDLVAAVRAAWELRHFEK